MIKSVNEVKVKVKVRKSNIRKELLYASLNDKKNKHKEYHIHQHLMSTKINQMR